jgi:hypothetical protein
VDVQQFALIVGPERFGINPSRLEGRLGPDCDDSLGLINSLIDDLAEDFDWKQALVEPIPVFKSR